MKRIYTNAPEVIKIALAAFPQYHGRQFKIKEFAGPMSLVSCWDGGSKSTYVLLSLETLRSIPVPENGTPWSNDGKIARLTELPVNAAVVEHSIFRGKDMGITLYLRPENLTPLLPAPTTELTLFERIVLCATCRFKSQARYDEAARQTGIFKSEYEAAKQSLITKGLLRPNGAATNDALNMAEDNMYKFGMLPLSAHGEVLKEEKLSEEVSLAFLADGRILRKDYFGWAPWKRLKEGASMKEVLAKREAQQNQAAPVE